jgi:Tfp pilus assembly protein PilF
MKSGERFGGGRVALDRRAVLAGLGSVGGGGLALTAAVGGAAWAAGETGHWKQAETSRFVVHGATDEATLREYAVKLEDFDMVLRYIHGLPIDQAPPRKLDIFLVNNTGGLRRAMPDASQDLRGYYVTSLVDVAFVAIVGRANNYSGNSRLNVENDDTMLHEYVHHFMKQYFNYAYAPWLVEGYAEYFMTTLFEGDDIVVGRLNSNRAGWLMNAQWMPLENLITEAPSIKDMNAPNYYPQAWLLTHYFMSDPARYAQLQAYMKAVGEGTPSSQAMQDATGKSLTALQSDLRAYSRTTLPVRVYTRKRKRVVEVTVTPMPASADDLLLENVRMIESSDDLKARKAFADDIRKKAARYPGDALAAHVLARAELQAENFAAAQAVIDARLAAAPDDNLALELKALILMAMGDADKAQQAARYKDAQGALGQAFKIDGERYQTLLAYARSRSLSPGYPSDNVMECLLLAYDLAPQVSEVALQAVRALAMRGDYARAVALLKPVANDPHNGNASARDLLAKLEAQAAAKAARAGGVKAPAKAG